MSPISYVVDKIQNKVEELGALSAAACRIRDANFLKLE